MPVHAGLLQDDDLCPARVESEGRGGGGGEESAKGRRLRRRGIWVELFPSRILPSTTVTPCVKM